MSDPGHNGAPDLSNLRPVYSTKPSRTMRWLVGVIVTTNTAAAVLRLTDNPDGWDVAVSILSIVFWFGFSYLILFGQPATRLSANGPAVRRSGRWRHYLWTQVREVQVQTRWTEVSLLVLDDERIVRLVGVPVEDAQRLADALHVWARP